MTPAVIRLPLDFDAARLPADLACVPDSDRVAHFNQRAYVVDWSILPLRAGQPPT